MKATGAAQIVCIVDLEGPRTNTQNIGATLRKILSSHYPEYLGVLSFYLGFVIFVN